MNNRAITVESGERFLGGTLSNSVVIGNTALHTWSLLQEHMDRLGEQIDVDDRVVVKITLLKGKP